jgi:lipopolysaccharide export LptBFGC system permease protein LptF
MKPVVITSVLLLISCCIHSQPGAADMQKQMDELRSRIKTLEKENQELESESRSNDSVAYCILRSEIFEAFTNVSQLDFNFKNTADKIAVTGLFTKLMQANNPTSDILGFRFTEIIYSSSEKHFKNLLKDEKDKKRFSQVISKIIDNPVVSSLVSTNPVTSVVASIISVVAGFTTSRTEVEKEGGRVKNVTVEQQDTFENKGIAAFRNELKVYIDFYDALIIASKEYLEGLNQLNRKYSYLIQSVIDYKAELYNELDFNESKLLMQLAKLLPDASTKGINFSDIIHDPKIQKSQVLARKYPILKQAVISFKKEYNTLLFNFLSDYIKTLKMAKDFPDSDIDKTKTEELINDIETFINSQKSKEQEELDAFR